MAGPENAAMHRFQAVAHVGQRAADDDPHGVVEVARVFISSTMSMRSNSPGVAERLKGIGRVVHLRGWPVLLICRSVASALGHRPGTGQPHGDEGGAERPFFHTLAGRLRGRGGVVEARLVNRHSGRISGANCNSPHLSAVAARHFSGPERRLAPPPPGEVTTRCSAGPLPPAARPCAGSARLLTLASALAGGTAIVVTAATASARRGAARRTQQ